MSTLKSCCVDSLHFETMLEGTFQEQLERHILNSAVHSEKLHSEDRSNDMCLQNVYPERTSTQLRIIQKLKDKVIVRISYDHQNVWPQDDDHFNKFDSPKVSKKCFPVLPNSDRCEPLSSFSSWRPTSMTFYSPPTPVMALFALLVIISVLQKIPVCSSSPRGIDWSQWWTYDGISGPRFWGVINPAWGMCKDGRRQSPINIDPRTLLFDPNLSPFTVDKVAVEGELINTGHSVEWHIKSSNTLPESRGSLPSLHTSSMHSPNLSDKPQLSDSDPNRLLLDSSLESTSRNYSLVSSGTRSRSGGGRSGSKGSSPSANISGGPLSYTYTLTHARLHFGERDQQGSEHLLDNHAFPAELQIYGYNSQLYRNFSQAVGQVYGIAAVAVLVQFGDRMSPEFRMMMEGVKSIKYGGSTTRTPPLVISGLLPPTQHYMTYEGSITEPACHETVTWILPNKPVYISLAMMRELRSLRQGNSDTLLHAPIANNFRPVQTAHHRTVRANINTRQEDGKDDRCQLSDPRLVYRAGSWLGS